MGHKNGEVQGQDRSCWSDPKVSVLELQNSPGLTNVIVSRCNHGIVNVFRFWINPPSRRPQLAFNSSRTRVVFLSVSVSLPYSRKLLQSFLIILGPAGFLHERIALKQQSRSLAELS